VVDSSGQENVNDLQIADITMEGMLFLSPQDIIGEDLLCRINRPKDESSFELTCKVKHRERSGDRINRIGVYFSDIPEGSKEKLSQCIKSPQRKK
jgi:c-di-GMP-binding flagellar brake protein YcgR